MQVHGFEFTPIQDGQAYSVNLNDEVIVVSKADGDRIAQSAQNADEVKAQVQQTKAKSSTEWNAERGEHTARDTQAEQARETMQNATTGEAHQESERNA